MRKVRGYEEFINLFKAWRRERKLSLLEAGKEIGVSQTTLSVFARRRKVRDSSIIAIAKWMSVDWQSALTAKRNYFANKATVESRLPAQVAVEEPMLEEEQVTEEPIPAVIDAGNSVASIAESQSTFSGSTHNWTVDSQILKETRATSFMGVLWTGMASMLLGVTLLVAGLLMELSEVQAALNSVVLQYGIYAQVMGYSQLIFGALVMLFWMVVDYRRWYRLRESILKGE